MSKYTEKQIAGSIAGATLAILLLLYLLQDSNHTGLIKPQIVKVETIKLTDEEHPPFITLHGATEALQLATLKATFATDVLNTFTYQGDKVKQGQTLLSLNCTIPDLELKKVIAKAENLQHNLVKEKNSLESARKALIHEKKLLTLTERSLKRHEALFAKKLGSEANLDAEKLKFHEQALQVNVTELNIQNYQASIKLIESNITENKHQQGLIKNDIQYCQPKAPFDGIILRRFVSKGERVSLGDPLISLFDNKAIVIRSQVPKHYAKAIQQAENDNQTLIAYDDAKLRYHIKSLNHDARNSQGSFEILLAPENQLDFPLIGHVTNYYLVLPPIKNSFSIPTKAIYSNSHVYKVVNQQLQRIQVTVIGPAWTPKQQGSITLVQTEALKTGDQVLITPLPQARTGLKVEVNHDSTNY